MEKCMSDDQRKKYEEAAIDWHAEHPETTIGDTFVAGCEFAFQELEERLTALQDENKRLIDLLERAVYYIDAHPSQRIITTGEKIVNEARKLLNP